MKTISLFEKRLLVLLLLLAVFSATSISYYDKQNKKVAFAIEQARVKNEKIRIAFADVNLLAKSAYVLIPDTKQELYTISANQVRPLASLTKIMTAVVALETLPETTKIEITSEALKEEGDNGLKKGEVWGRNDLIEFMLVVSSNDAAKAIELAGGSNFIDLMNEKARSLGMINTHYLNSSGLDISKTQAGAYGTARDTALLLEYAIKTHPGTFEVSAKEKITFNPLHGKIHTAINTNPVIASLPELLASKTGLTNLAGGNLAIAFGSEEGKTIIAVVLGSSYEGRFLDIEQLSASSHKALQVL